jgi:ATP-binding cassette subfamily B protein
VTAASPDARYPALGRLGAPKAARRIPHVAQLEAADCGAACLAMVLAFWGRHVGLDECRRALRVDGNGTGALTILEVARRYGLRGRGVRAELDELDCLPKGAILHWQFNHFVVFERATAREVVVLDPASGRRRIPMARFAEGFTGVALLLEPGAGFVRGGERRTSAAALFGKVLSYRPIWARIVVLSVLVQVLALGLPLLTSVLVDRVVPRQDVELLWVLGGGLAMMLGFNFLTTLVRGNLLVHLRTLLDAEMTVGFVDHMVGLPFAFFQRRSAGDLMMRMGSNATVREILTSGALSAVLDGTMVVAYLAVILALSPVLAAVVVGLALGQLGLFLATRRRQRELMTDGLAAQARTSAFEVEMLGGIETIKSMGAEYRAVDRWSNLFTDHLNVSLSRARLDAFVAAAMAAFSMAAPLVVLATGALLVLDGQLSLGTMLGLGALAAGFLGPVAALVSTTFKLQLLGSYLERIEDVVKTPLEQPAASARPAHALQGRITAHRVSFRYGESTKLAVDNVSLDIAPGQFVAIVGPSGAGKSTLAKLLVGLHPPNAGQIAYDGVELHGLELTSVRQQLGVVSQHPTLFGMSVRENIALARPDATLDEVIVAARYAQIHDDIAALPMGYDTVLADGGGSLSGGQRQRLALARALLGWPAVLVLDEATSALDAITEYAVQCALAQLNCTRIVVAHRLSTVMHADAIVVMDEGRIVEWGTHDQLIGRGGVYRRLCDGQLDRRAS